MTSFFTDTYARLARLSSIKEEEPCYRAKEFLREKVIKCVWFDQHFETKVLRTDDGRRLIVHSPGWWNMEGGPDFRDAIIELQDEGKIKGDVEIDLRASDWTLHNHHRTGDYNSVVLHCVLWNDLGNTSVPKSDGTEAVQLTMESYLGEDIEELCEAFDPNDYPPEGGAHAGACQSILEGDDSRERLARFLEYAGDERILSKARRLIALAGERPAQELFYIAIMEALGFRRNRHNFLRLALRLPLEVAETLTTDQVQSALFGLSGLLAQACPSEKSSAEYVRKLQSLWRELKLEGEPMSASEWFFKGTRPQNFPTRRIAAASRLFPFSTFFRESVESLRRGNGGLILDRLCSVSDEFWDWRTNFSSKRLTKRTRLIGIGRARSIVIDAVLPAILVYARKSGESALEHSLHNLYDSFPKLPESQVTRFVAGRLFGRDELSRKLIHNARRQQGLYELFKDFCQHDRAGCQDCPLLKYLSEGTRQC